MSVECLEYDAETVEILLLQGQAALSGFEIRHDADDTNPDIDRIIVKAEQAQPELVDAKGEVTKVYMIPVRVTVHFMTKDVSGMNAIVAAVVAANNTSQPAAVTAAQAAFSGGPKIEEDADGETDHSDNVRTRSKAYRFYVNP